MGYEVKAPLPGVILRVEVAEGQAINMSDVLLVLEAMKMENDIPAEAAGTVKKILVEAGQTVKSGDVLMEVE